MGTKNTIFVAAVLVGVLIISLLPDMIYVFWRIKKGRLNSVKIADVLLILLGMVSGVAFFLVIRRI